MSSEPTANSVQRGLDPIERWFVQRGVPHFVERSVDGSMLDTWTRALPLLVVAYILLGFNALDLLNGSILENLSTAAVVLLVLLGTWVISNRLRGQPLLARPGDIDPPELMLFLGGPALPSILVGQFGDAVETVIYGLVLLLVIYWWSSYGVGSLLRWTWNRGRSQLTGLGSLVARALPLLLVFNMFLFINAEVWEVAGNLDGLVFWTVLGILFALGSTFSASRIPAVIRSMNTFANWGEVDRLVIDTPAAAVLSAAGLASGGVGGNRAAVAPDVDRLADIPHEPLRWRQRFNIGLIVLLGQALQVLLVVGALMAFFVAFGVLAFPPPTVSGWTQNQSVDQILSFWYGGRELVLSWELLRVSAFLSAFSGMYFTVLLSTDDTYQSEFADDVGPAIREALAVRVVYRRILSQGTAH